MKRNATILLLFFSFFSPLFADQLRIVGAEGGWGELIFANRVERIDQAGREVLRLQDARTQLGSTSQLLLGFDEYPLHDAAGHFTVTQDIARISSVEYRFGRGSGVFEGSPLVLENRSADFFQPASYHRSFTISFFLYSARLRDGEEILHWRGLHDAADGLVSQAMRIVVQNRRLQLQFRNMFQTPEQQMYSVQLTGYEGLLPRRWSHHFIRYSAATGMLEYVVNGVHSAISYITPTGRENGEGFPVHIGNRSGNSLSIGDGLTGLLDDFHIAAQALPYPDNRTVTYEPGRVVVAPVDFEYSRTRLMAVEVKTREPVDTQVRSYYRSGNQLDQRGNVVGSWRPIEELQDEHVADPARYVQLQFELLSDGVGNQAPQIESAHIRYSRLPPPIPPAHIQVESVEKGLRLQWQPVFDARVGGYKVFYGKQPGRYFGESAGNSPLDVGEQNSVVLDNLQPNVLYYVSIVSYDKDDDQLVSSFSREVTGRPKPSMTEAAYEE